MDPLLFRGKATLVIVRMCQRGDAVCILWRCRSGACSEPLGGGATQARRQPRTHRVPQWPVRCENECPILGQFFFIIPCPTREMYLNAAQKEPFFYRSGSVVTPTCSTAAVKTASAQAVSSRLHLTAISLYRCTSCLAAALVEMRATIAGVVFVQPLFQVPPGAELDLAPRCWTNTCWCGSVTCWAEVS